MEAVRDYTKRFSAEKAEASLLRSVFAWMTLGLALTGLVSWAVLSLAAPTSALFSPWVYIPLLLVELGVVFYLAARIEKLSPAAAAGWFLFYAGLNGVTLAPIAMVYTAQSIATTFFVTAGMFGAMALYGYTTKRSLNSLGGYLFIGLIGLIIAMVVNAFIGSSTMGYIISAVAVLVFLGLTAYDVQKIKEMGYQVAPGSDDWGRVGIMGALALYLDFINLMLHLLRFLGVSKD